MTIKKKYQLTFIINLSLALTFIVLIPIFAIKYFSPTEFEDTTLVCQSVFHEELYKKLTTKDSGDLIPGERIIMIYSQDRGIIYSFNKISAENIQEIVANLPLFTRFKYRTEPFSYKDDNGVFVFIVDKRTLVGNIRTYIVPILIISIFLFIVIPAIVNFTTLYNLRKTFNNLESAARKVSKGDFDQVLVRTKMDELYSFYQSFNEMNRTLKDNRDQKSRLLMSISHDLKTPLTSMKGYIEAFSDGMVPPDKTGTYMDIIKRKSDILEERINTLIDYSKIETSEWKSNFQEIHIDRLLTELIPIYKEDCLIYNREFKYLNNLKEGLKISGDYKLLFRVLENILENAKRYTEDKDLIYLTCSNDDSTILITIEDQGIGISEQDQQYIFEPFYKSDRGRNSKGLGMGLYTVKSIIYNHGGTIEVKSTLNKGTCFIIKLPIYNG